MGAKISVLPSVLPLISLTFPVISMSVWGEEHAQTGLGRLVEN
jgi:hypothetical protein